ncbi:MAG: dihydrodipicolinate synthase family protein [Planctomycetaceae bacterium]
MQTTPVTAEQFSKSVLAVPPLARDATGKIDAAENAKIVRHIEGGGVSMFLYGGNANLYHIRPSEYADLLGVLSDIAADDTLMIPAVGPAYGMMMDQADILKTTDFPTAMVLPSNAVMTEAGVINGFRDFVEAFGKPAVLYIKEEGYISPEGAADLVDEGLVSFIKYAIVREDTKDDPFLKRLLDRVDKKKVCSGIGEQPAIIHMQDFGLIGYTSGCVCVNPAASQRMLTAIGNKDFEAAEIIRNAFEPLEDLRNDIHPIRVLHEAVRLAGIAETGRQMPLLSGIANSAEDDVKKAATDLMAMG